MSEHRLPSSETAQHTLPQRAFRGRLARRMVLILLPAILIPVLLMGYLVHLRSQRLLEEQTAQQLYQVETEMKDSIGTWLLAKSARLDAVARRSYVQGAIHTLVTPTASNTAVSWAKNTITRAFTNIPGYRDHPIFNQYLILDQDLQVLASTRPEWEGLSLQNTSLSHIIENIGQNKAVGLPWIKTGTEVTTRLFAPDAYGNVHAILYDLTPLYPHQTALVTVLPHYDFVAQKQLYIIGLSEEVAVERTITQLSQRYPNSRGFIVLYDGQYLSIDPRTEALAVWKTPEFLTKQIEGQATIIEGTYDSPVTQKPSFAVAEWLPNLNAAIGLEIPKTMLLATSRQLAPYTTRLLLITALLLAAIIWFATSRISQPILEMAKSARRFAEGDWKTRASIKRDDEIGLLAYTFNQMADELIEFYRSLEQQVEERTLQIRTASEVAHLATSATDLSEILRRTVNLIVERFPQYYHASVFLLDEEGRYANLAESTGPVGEQMKRQGHRLAVGGQSLVGWAAAHREPRIASDVVEDEIHFKNPLLPETRSEAAIPIAVGDRVLGVLDVQSKNPHAFDEQSIATLQTLASQLAAALYNARLRQQAEAGLEETQLLYRASHKLINATQRDEVLRLSTEALESLPFTSAVFIREGQNSPYRLRYAHFAKGEPPEDLELEIPISREILKRYAPPSQPLIIDNFLYANMVPEALVQAGRALGCASGTYIAIYDEGVPFALLFLGSDTPQSFSPRRVEPYIILTEIISATLAKITALEDAQRRLAEFQVLVRLLQSLAAETSPEDFYASLHKEIRNIFGDVSLIVALYNPLRRTIEVPYAYEQDEGMIDIPPFTLGEGLISHVITQRQPLLIGHDLKEAARSLGITIKSIGAIPQSWLGVPMFSGDQLVGALVLQDLHTPDRFHEKDVELVSALANSIALLLNRLQLLSQTERVYRREHLLFEISQHMRRTGDIQDLLNTTIRRLQSTFSARRGTIRINLTPPPRADDHGSGDNGHSPAPGEEA